MRSRCRALSVAVVVIVGLVACGGSSEKETARPAGPDPPPRVPAGYVDFTDAEDRVAVAVPENWQIPRNADLLQKEADAVRGQNPRLAEILLSAKTLITRATVFAIHPEGAASMNLLVEKASKGSLDDIPGPAIAQVRQRGGTVESQERTTLGGVPAVKVAMESPFNAGATIHQVQYFAVKEERVYILTLTGRDPALDVIARSMAIR